MAKRKCSVTNKKCTRKCVVACKLNLFNYGIHIIGLTGLLSTISLICLERPILSILSALLVPSIYSFGSYMKNCCE